MAAHQVTMKYHDRSWNLTQWWNRKAFAMRHTALNARQVAEGLAHKLGLPPPEWKSELILPDELDQPIQGGDVD